MHVCLLFVVRLVQLYCHLSSARKKHAILRRARERSKGFAQKHLKNNGKKGRTMNMVCGHVKYCLFSQSGIKYLQQNHISPSLVRQNREERDRAVFSQAFALCKQPLRSGPTGFSCTENPGTTTRIQMRERTPGDIQPKHSFRL